MINTVLSIDDDQVTQLINNYNLELDSFCTQMIEAYNGEEALNFFEKLANGNEPMSNFPEVTFIDLNMPIMDGWEFFETFEKIFPQFVSKTKLFILSSSINPEDEERAKNEKNIVAFLRKPLDEENLERVRNLLGI